MSHKIRCAVIGGGNMGKNHIRTYTSMQQVELVGIAEVNAQSCSDLHAEFGTVMYADYKELLEKEHPDAVSICVPTVLHYEVAKYCLSKKVHVLLEKPIAATVSEGAELLALAKQSSVRFLVGHIERFNPAVCKIKEMVDKGELGNVIALVARRVGGFPPQIKDCDIAVDLAIHDVDIANFILGSLPVEVHSHKQKNHILQREDSVELFLKYKGSSAFIQANWITPVKIRKISITGSEGYLEMDYITQQIEFYKSNYEKFKFQIGDFSDYVLRFSEPDKMVISVAKKEPLKEEISYFLQCILQNESIDSQFALDSLQIVTN